MSTQSCTSSTSQWIPLVKTFTGTKDQPDNVSIFYKDANGKIEIMDEAFVNSMGHSPFLMITALPRINKAIKQIFKELSLGFSREDSELWNAFKNLARGGAQLVPLLGNAILYVLDYFRTNFYFHPKIKAALASENNPVMGFAFDGKVVATFSPEELKSFFNRSHTSQTEDYEVSLAHLYTGWLVTLQETQNNSNTDTRLELVQDLERRIKAARPT